MDHQGRVAPPQGLKREFLEAASGTEQVAEKRNPSRTNDHSGLKPALIARNSRDPKGPLFHGDAGICNFFRSL